MNRVGSPDFRIGVTRLIFQTAEKKPYIEHSTSRHLKSKEAGISSRPTPQTIDNVLRASDTSSMEIDKWLGKKENSWISIFIRVKLRAAEGCLYVEAKKEKKS